jgi:hypothetical protein
VRFQGKAPLDRARGRPCAGMNRPCIAVSPFAVVQPASICSGLGLFRHHSASLTGGHNLFSRAVNRETGRVRGVAASVR